MGRLGADVDELDRLARSFETGADALTSCRTSIGSTLRKTGWDGADARRFLTAWDAEHSPVLGRVVRELEQAGKILRDNADEQRRASEAGGTAVGGAVTGSRSGAGSAGVTGEPADALRNPPDDYGEVTRLLAEARALGLSPDEYRPLLERYWQLRATEVAGIDLSAWDPGLGADVNRETIEAVYRFYGDLYLADPDLQWAGMANMVGPAFAAGFFDLAQFRTLAEELSNVPPPLDQALPPGLEEVARMSADELRFYETTFLDMQKQIFLDQGTMHQAYADGGMEAIRELEAAHLIKPEIAAAWAGIDSGDPARVQSANELFLYREQHEIIDDDYTRMYEHAPTGPAMTWMMTQVGTPSIPGAQGYPDIDPLTLRVQVLPDAVGTPRSILGHEIPHVSIDLPGEGVVAVETPFAGGNFASFDDRWRLIEQDTLPAFQRLLAEDPDLARSLIAADVGDRIGDYRMTERIDEILAQLGDWDVRYE